MILSILKDQTGQGKPVPNRQEWKQLEGPVCHRTRNSAKFKITCT